MLVDDHLQKIERLERSRTKLDPLSDYELWYFSILTTGMHAINAALHVLGVTMAEDCFAHNVPVYVCAEPKTGTWQAVIRPFGDLEHVEGDEIKSMIPSALEPACEALLVLESLRDASLRDDIQVTTELVNKIQEAYDVCLRNVRDVIENVEEYAR